MKKKDEQTKEQTKISSVRLPVSLDSQLKAEADRQDRTKHSLIIHILRDYFRKNAQRPDANK